MRVPARQYLLHSWAIIPECNRAVTTSTAPCTHSPRAVPAALVKTKFLHKKSAMVKWHSPRKSGKTLESCHTLLCEPKMDIHNQSSLWKTPVEKPVENVENSEFSTGIPALCTTRPSCGEMCIPGCIFSSLVAKWLCYVTGTNLATT